MKTIFWVSLLALVYPYGIYPSLLVAWNRFCGRRLPGASLTSLPTVTVILPVHNEARRIEAKIANLLDLNYPRDRLQVVVVGDGCTDETLAKAEMAGGASVCVHALPNRCGKAAALNEGLERATGEFVVFTDAGILLEANALENLIRSFGDANVGCVSGEDYVGEADSEGLYGRLELLLRREEARLHSIAGASGCFYGVRRSLCVPFKSGMAPDFLSVLETVRSGYHAVCEPTACGYMAATKSQRAEFARKTRTFLRGMTTLSAYTELLNPARYPAFAFVLWSHKVMRWLGPVWLTACFLSTYALREEPRYAFLLTSQVCAYVIALVGILVPAVAERIAPIRLCAFFFLVNAAAAKALLLWLAGVRQELWEPTQRPK